MICQFDRGAKNVYAETASFCEPRPIINSASKMGKPINKVKMIKIKKNAPPPETPTIYGNFHIAPRPIAEPAVAKINPNFELHCSCCCFIRSEEHTSEL